MNQKRFIKQLERDNIDMNLFKSELRRLQGTTNKSDLRSQLLFILRSSPIQILMSALVLIDAVIVIAEIILEIHVVKGDKQNLVDELQKTQLMLNYSMRQLHSCFTRNRDTKNKENASKIEQKHYSSNIKIPSSSSHKMFIKKSNPKSYYPNADFSPYYNAKSSLISPFAPPSAHPLPIKKRSIPTQPFPLSASAFGSLSLSASASSSSSSSSYSSYSSAASSDSPHFVTRSNTSIIELSRCCILQPATFKLGSSDICDAESVGARLNCSSSLHSIFMQISNMAHPSEALHSKENEPDDNHLHDVSMLLHYISIGILGFFVCEVGIKIACLGAKFIREKFEVVDAVIIITSFTADIIFVTLAPQEILVMIIFLLWRIVRVINGLLMHEKQRDEFRVQLQKRARRLSEMKVENLRNKKELHEKHIHNLQDLCNSLGASAEQITNCKPRQMTASKVQTNNALKSMAAITTGMFSQLVKAGPTSLGSNTSSLLASPIVTGGNNCNKFLPFLKCPASSTNTIANVNANATATTPNTPETTITATMTATTTTAAAGSTESGPFINYNNNNEDVNQATVSSVYNHDNSFNYGTGHNLNDSIRIMRPNSVMSSRQDLSDSQLLLDSADEDAGSPISKMSNSDYKTIKKLFSEPSLLSKRIKSTAL